METPNPFTYDDSADSVSGKVMSMTFKNADGSPVKVADLDTPVDIWMPGMENQSTVRTLCLLLHTKIICVTDYLSVDMCRKTISSAARQQALLSDVS